MYWFVMGNIKTFKNFGKPYEHKSFVKVRIDLI